jgi:hypothetical protein
MVARHGEKFLGSAKDASDAYNTVKENMQKTLDHGYEFIAKCNQALADFLRERIVAKTHTVCFYESAARARMQRPVKAAKR